MKRMLGFAVALVILFSTLSTEAFANEEIKLLKDVKDTRIEKIKSIKEEFDTSFSIKSIERVNIKGNYNNLLKVFDSQEEALETVKKRCEKLIDIIKSHYGLEELSDNNWEDYYDKLNLIIDESNTGVQESDYEYRFLRAFFDVYENKYKNDKVKDVISSDFTKEKDQEEVVAENLPYNVIFVENYYNKLGIEDTERYDDLYETKDKLQLRASINVDDAVDYATTHAENPNESSYYYFSHGDCTNFVSQILENAGVNQEVYDSEYSGWWHKYNPNAWINKHKHSRSWTMADTFARYMGVILTRTNHRNFSANIEKGSIIGGDWTNDGDWDHMAFVTSADNYVGSYGYYDYKVAQHTSNYHKWTSSSGNNWESVEDDGGKYGRIRH